MIEQENIPYTADEIKAMVKTCEKYNAALDKASKLRVQNPFDTVGQMVEHIFPELKGNNNNEKIRKEIVDFITSSNKYGTNERCEAWLNWLEKQGEQPTDKIKSKFKEGDYIVPYNVTPLEIWKVINIDDDGYYNIQSITDPEDDEIYRVPGFILEKDYRLWTINDANDGDVLAVNNRPFIYNGSKNEVTVGAYCGFDARRIFSFSYNYVINQNITPATKEQSDLLFQKMKEAGYEWKQEEKKLIKMKETKFKPSDWIANGGANHCYVKSIFGDYYELCSCEGYEYTKHIIDVDYIYHLWTIDDAKDGDVLVDEDNNIGLYSGEKNDLDWQSCIYLGCDGYLRGTMGYHKRKNTKPATKEQRDLLFSKMKQEGYEWKQEEKKLIKTKETKFKPGDWIATDDSFGKIVRHVDEISSNIIDERYVVSDEYGLTYNISFDKEHKWHKWTIQDATNGDVLVNGSNIFIFRCINHTRLMGYCHVNIDDGRFYDDTGKNECFCLIDAEVTPATKEQRELLFSKMKQEGYEWNAENKKLSKQPLKIMPKFCVGQLITDDNGTWYRITNIKCLDDWYYEVYDACEDTTRLELCSIIDEKFRENRFVDEIKKMMGD